MLLYQLLLSLGRVDISEDEAVGDEPDKGEYNPELAGGNGEESNEAKGYDTVFNQPQNVTVFCTPFLNVIKRHMRN